MASTWLSYLNNRIDDYGSYPDPFGPYAKPDSNIQVPDGTPVTALASGTVSGLVVNPSWGEGTSSLTIKLDTPINALATHMAYNFLGSTTVKLGDHVSSGQVIGAAGGNARYGFGVAFALTHDDVYGTTTFNQYNGNPNLDPVGVLNLAAGTTSSGSPLILRAFLDEVLHSLRGDYESPQEVVNFMISWAHQEGGGVTNAAKFNPLNTMQKEPKSTQAPGNILPGIQAYPDGATGILATTDALKNGNYGNLEHALSTGDLDHLGFTGKNNAHQMAGNVAGDLSVWVSGKRTPLAQNYILSIMANAGIAGASIEGVNVTGGAAADQATIDSWANVSLGNDTSGITVGGATNNALDQLSGINTFFQNLTTFFSDPVRIFKILAGIALIITGLVLLTRALLLPAAKQALKTVA